MVSGEAPDPVRSTLVAILQQLNRIEALHEGQPREQSVELSDLERLLRKFWAIEEELVKVSLALGLLVRNGFVRIYPAGAFPPRPAAPSRARYRITAEGKQFLMSANDTTDRIA